MTLRLRLLAAFALLVAGPVAVGLLISRAPLADELVIFGAAVLVGLGASWIVASMVARPIGEMAEAAERVARGEPDARVPVRTGDEIGKLASSLNAIAESLRRRTADAQSSRDQMRESVRRLGEALRSTHDLMKLLSVVLETALAAVGGTSGAIYLLSARRNELVIKVGRHLDPTLAEKRIALGQGLAGWVAEHRTSTKLPSPSGPSLAEPEPMEATAIAVPLETQSQLLGVLAIYGHGALDHFRDDDLETIEFLARQAGIGIDNILLHQEAERQAITDGLTGLWNHRFFQMTASKALAQAKRHDRTLSMLVIDIDDFKKVNDQYGHQRGDAILIEVASRISNHVREGETLARYGGEEFVMVSEIDAPGARVVAERVRRDVAARPFGDEGERPLKVTVSIGYATFPFHGTTPETLLRSADTAMYAAKARGKNRVVGADELDDWVTLAPGPARP